MEKEYLKPSMDFFKFEVGDIMDLSNGAVPGPGEIGAGGGLGGPTDSGEGSPW